MFKELKKGIMPYQMDQVGETCLYFCMVWQVWDILGQFTTAGVGLWMKRNQECKLKAVY